MLNSSESVTILFMFSPSFKGDLLSLALYQKKCRESSVHGDIFCKVDRPHEATAADCDSECEKNSSLLALKASAANHDGKLVLSWLAQIVAGSQIGTPN